MKYDAPVLGMSEGTSALVSDPSGVVGLDVEVSGCCVGALSMEIDLSASEGVPPTPLSLGIGVPGVGTGALVVGGGVFAAPAPVGVGVEEEVGVCPTPCAAIIDRGPQ